MENYIYGSLAVIAVVIVGLLLFKKSKPEPKPVPENGQPVLDHAQNEWVFLRTVSNGTFMFRSPRGTVNVQTLEQMEKNGFLNQFDFEAIQKI